MGLKKTLASLVLVGAAALGGLTGKLKADSWTILDNPWGGSTSTYNLDGNEVVGCYGGSFTHGFSYNRSTGNWTDIEAPNSTAYTQVNSIDNGQVVGRYMDGSGSHGFVYENGNWTTLNMPGMISTEVGDIDGTNVVGSGWNGNWHGFLYDKNNNWNPLDKPGASNTQITGISGNKIVGVYNSNYSFLYDGTNWTNLEMPGAANTLAMAVDGDNIGGFYYDTQDKMHGFLYDGKDNWKTIDAPNATERTAVFGINGDELLGYSKNGSGFHGFIYTIPEPTTISLLGLGALGLVGKRRKSES